MTCTTVAATCEVCSNSALDAAVMQGSSRPSVEDNIAYTATHFGLVPVF